jgi:DNA-binding transcriptional MerR regulator
MPKDEYLIQELSEETGLSIRTIRYYQGEGLLPEPINRGKFAYYTSDHLKRLKLIQELKENHLPLKQIREHLNKLSTDQVQALLQRQKIRKETPSTPRMVFDRKQVRPDSDTALDYIARVLQTQEELKDQEQRMNQLERFSIPTPQRYTAGTPTERWRRITLAPGIEIQIREPLSPQDQKRLEELIHFTKKLFK